MVNTVHGDQPLTFIDLFAGAGGLSEGFVSCGFKAIAHVEMNPHACNTLKTRACYWWLREHDSLPTYYEYLKGTIDREELYKSVPDSVLNSVICAEMKSTAMPDMRGISPSPSISEGILLMN